MPSRPSAATCRAIGNRARVVVADFVAVQVVEGLLDGVTGENRHVESSA
jgi:hypothetical protein